MLTPLQIREHLPDPSGAVLCAVSGGLDSMVLLHLLRRWCGKTVTAAHFNHQLRSAADRDEAFVRDWCGQQGIPFAAGRGDVGGYAAAEGLSMEEAARILRYRFLRSEMEKRGGCVCTAHHMEDNAETVLLNLIRGTGIRGLRGIPAYRDGIYRPLLTVSRAEIREYADFYGIPHVEDESNADPDAADRNFLRHRVLPLLRELNPRVEEHLLSLSRQAGTVDAFLETEAERCSQNLTAEAGRVTLSGAALSAAPDAVRPRMIQAALDRLGAGRKNFGARQLEAILGLSAAQGEKRLNLPEGVTARYTGGALILEQQPPPLPETVLLPGVPLLWGSYTLTLREAVPSGTAGEGNALFIRGKRGDEPGRMTVAPCRPGGRLALPEGGSRTIKRLCLDRGVSLLDRDRLPAFYADGRLAAVWRLGVDAAFLPGSGPCRMLAVRETT